jgi:hypothetical protein
MNIQHWPRKREQRNTEQADGRRCGEPSEHLKAPGILELGAAGRWDDDSAPALLHHQPGEMRKPVVLDRVGISSKPTKQIGLAVCARHVARRKDLHLPRAVFADDFLRADLHLASEDRIGGDQLLDQPEVVRSLALIIGENESVAARR